jgi:hypothetical protein
MPYSYQCSGSESGSTGSHMGLPDPDPDPGQRYGSGSGSFYHQAKIVRKTLIPIDFLCNDIKVVPSKSYKQKKCF